MIRAFKNIDWHAILPASFLSLLKGSVLSQLITLASMPFIARLYGPEPMGAFLFIFSIAAIIGESSTLRLESGFFVEPRPSKLAWLKGGALATSFFVCLAAFVPMLAFFAWRAGGLCAEAFLNAALSAGIASSFGVRHTMHAWAIRQGLPHVAARALVLKAAVLVLLQASLGVFAPVVLSLLLAELVSTCVMLGPLGRTFGFRFTDAHVFLRARVIKWCLKNYKPFVLYEAPSHLVRTLVARLPVIGITMLYGPAQVGLYGLAYQIVQLPNRHIGGNMGDVIQMEAGTLVRTQKPDQIKPLFIRYSKLLAAVATVPLLGVLVLAPSVFPFVLGQQWQQTGFIAQILAPWMFAALLVPTISRILLVIKRQVLKLWFDSLMLVALGAVFVCAFALDLSFIQLISLMTTSFVIVYMFYYLCIYNCIQKRQPRQVG